MWPASGGSGWHASRWCNSAVQWANVTDVSVGGTTFASGQQLQISYIYQDRDSEHRHVLSGPDRNPYNNNIAATLGTAQLNSSSSINSIQTNVSTAGVASGTYWLATKVADAGGRFRYAYGKQVTLINTTPPPRRPR